MEATKKPLHPDVKSIATVGATPSARWTDAVERAREIARQGVAEQNLPGLSVAVGSSDEIVWAEGFGWADIEKQTPVAPDTRFRIGTTSIPLTSAALALL